MKSVILALVFCILLLCACSQPAQDQPLEIMAAWARPATSGQNSAVYLTIRNPNAEPDRLIAAQSSAATAVELHLSTMDSSGVMSMQPQEAIDLPAGDQVELKPGGLHVMLIDLKQDLIPGESLELTLEFDRSEPIRLSVPIQEQP